MKKSEGKGTIDEVDWNGWLVTNWNSICKKFVFFSCTTRDLRS